MIEFYCYFGLINTETIISTKSTLDTHKLLGSTYDLGFRHYGGFTSTQSNNMTIYLYPYKPSFYYVKVRFEEIDFITQTRPCNIQQCFTAVKMLIFR